MWRISCVFVIPFAILLFLFSLLNYLDMGFGPISRTMHLGEPEDFRQCSCGCGRTAPCFTFNVFALKVNGNHAVSTDILRVLCHFHLFS